MTILRPANDTDYLNVEEVVRRATSEFTEIHSFDGLFLVDTGFGLATMIEDFALIDLFSQREAVRVILRGLDTSNRLEWLKAQGTVYKIEHRESFPATYCFESRLGIIARFFFNDFGDIVFLGDHSTLKD